MLFRSDDFTNLVSVLEKEDSSFLMKAIHTSKIVYFTWQGTYFGNLYTYIAGAIFHFGGIFALHIEYLCVILFFFFGYSNYGVRCIL